MFRIVTWSERMFFWEETQIVGNDYTEAVQRLLSAGPRPGVRYAVQSKDPHGVTQRVELLVRSLRHLFADRVRQPDQQVERIGAR